MPALWQASERPMFIRTVWVDGVRHAILNSDDPHLRRAPRRPLSSASHPAREPHRALGGFRSSRRSHGGDQLEECFRKLQIVINGRRRVETRPKRSTTERRERDSPVEKLDFGDIQSDSEEELVLKASTQPLCQLETSRSRYDGLSVEMRPAKTPKSRPSESNDRRYDLSDRVFEWLDLAGRDLLPPDSNDARLARPRHSCPEIEKRIPHQHFTRKPPERRMETPKLEDTMVRPEASIDRPAPPRKPVRTTVKTSQDRPPSSVVDANFATRQKVVAEIYDVERQYAQLVGRAADGCGRRIKRQVHIFMPPLPKKPPSAAASRADSLLSRAS